MPSEVEEEEVKSNNVWEHAIDILFKLSPLHPDGNSLRKWVKHQNMDDMEQFNGMGNIWQLKNFLHLNFENSWDKGNPEFLMTNPIKNLRILQKYLHHLVREAQE